MKNSVPSSESVCVGTDFDEKLAPSSELSGGGLHAINDSELNNIVPVNHVTKSTPKRADHEGKYVATDAEETCVIDSGACTAVLKPDAFPNTAVRKTNLSGTRYKACGGNPVTNMGEKKVAVVDSEGNVISDLQF